MKSPVKAPLPFAVALVPAALRTKDFLRLGLVFGAILLGVFLAVGIP